jgi:hypothetical protein
VQSALPRIGGERFLPLIVLKQFFHPAEQIIDFFVVGITIDAQGKNKFR